MNSKTYWLQYFADGAPAGDGSGDGGAAAGVDGAAVAPQGTRQQAAVAGQQDTAGTLEKLGVPKDKARRFAASMQRRGLKTEAAQPPETAPADGGGDEGDGAEKPAASQAKPKWEDLLKDPEYKAAFDSQVSGIISKRFAKTNAREESMAKLTPALEMLAKKYGTNAGDYEGLAHAIVDDDSLYEVKAAEMGVDVKTAKVLSQREQELESLREQQKMSFQQQIMRDHIARLNQQAEALRAEFPDFSLETEMQNDMFVKLTQPGMLSVEDAYRAVHRKEIAAAQKQAMQQQAMAAAQAAVRAGQARPKENGAGIAVSITRVPPAQRSKAEREELKRRIYAADARGEKLPVDW